MRYRHRVDVHMQRIVRGYMQRIVRGLKDISRIWHGMILSVRDVDVIQIVNIL